MYVGGGRIERKGIERKGGAKMGVVSQGALGGVEGNDETACAGPRRAGMDDL
jgi:hypothetical protein